MSYFNQQRLSHLKEQLEIHYEKQHEFEKKILLAVGGEGISLQQTLKREVLPELRKAEREYAELLASGTPESSIPNEEAEPIVVELVEATTDLERYQATGASAEMMRLLEEIQQQLADPGKVAAAKLKVALPVLPLLASYELELDTESILRRIWDKTRALFQSRHPRNLSVGPSTSTSDPTGLKPPTAVHSAPNSDFATRESRILETLAQVLDDRTEAWDVLGSAGFPLDRCPAFTNPRSFWQEVARLVNKGLLPSLEPIVAKAAELYPYHSELQSWKGRPPPN